jgi:LPXTG-site transpeptidase (sortase) family protein
MNGWCPNLGLVGNRKQVFSVATQRHRCYAQEQPERIGGEHQTRTCLTAAYDRCPRLGVEVASLTLPRSETARREKESGRRWTSTEVMVLGLGLAILLAVSFIGYAVVHRLQVGPGMAAPALVAEAGTIATATASPTLAPTFTPTASPTAPVVILETAPVTPIPEPALPTPVSVTRPPADSPPTRLVIPKITIDIPVLPVGIKTIRERTGSRVIWADVPNAGGFHQTSAYPGHPGNTVINGHRDIQGSVFRHLDKVKAGDQILIYVGEEAYPYQVSETLVVPETFASTEQRADNLRLIGNMPEERLTLITCTPVGLATHRLLVIARPPDQIMPQMPEAGQSTQP